MRNVDDELPVFEPANQVVQVKKNAGSGSVLHYVQAYDPDGSGLTFTVGTGKYRM